MGLAFLFIMVFNDITTLNGAVQECEAWLFGRNYGSISGNTQLLKSFTSLLNYGLDQAIIEIMKTDGTWRYEDPNQTDLPIAKTNLSEGENNYELDNSHLTIIGVEVLDKEGNYYPLRQIDYTDIRKSGQSDTEFFTENGKPMYYDPEGSILKIYPAPSSTDTTLTNGLRVHFQREPDYFVYTDTTKEIGIPRMFQDLPVLFACAKYAKQNSMADKARELDAELARVSSNIKNFISKRNVDKRKRINPAYRSAQ